MATRRLIEKPPPKGRVENLAKRTWKGKAKVVNKADGRADRLYAKKG